MENNSEKALELALEALERIATHEKECVERLTDSMIELRELKLATRSHAQRWEKLAWMVIGTVTTTVIAAWVALIFNL